MSLHKWVLAVVMLLANSYVDGFGFLWPPWQQQVLPNKGLVESCGTPQVASVVLLLRLTPLDITEAKDSMTLWNFESISRTLHDRATQIEGENLFNLFTVERFLPSEEFIEATNALTAIQKGHIGGLFIANRQVELDQIMNGIILSLPDEVQIKARNFMILMDYLVCLHSSLQEPPYF